MTRKTGRIDLWSKMSIVVIVCQALFSVYRLLRQPSKKLLNDRKISEKPVIYIDINKGGWCYDLVINCRCINWCDCRCNY